MRAGHTGAGQPVALAQGAPPRLTPGTGVSGAGTDARASLARRPGSKRGIPLAERVARESDKRRRGRLTAVGAECVALPPTDAEVRLAALRERMRARIRASPL